MDRVEKWVAEGTLLQINARSLLGAYGAEAQRVARELLRRGWVSCVASDYHARGRPDFEAAIHLLTGAEASLEDRGSETPKPPSGAAKAAIRTLLQDNPTRILADQPTAIVPPLEVPEPGPMKRARRWFR